jgi:UTP-glucose-1-phosphate uridylyltransferase
MVLPVYWQVSVFILIVLRVLRYDCGSKLGYLQANVALGLRDAEIGTSLSSMVAR